mmetsp:Transcript_41466/g.119539  ORF Transcript_41466/g.119539 Transcript_41466/m.119539 type:complete len:362 (-) Transcript_41466:160-1245(-)
MEAPGSPGESAVLRLGLIADIQFADIDDAPCYFGSGWRRYRNSLNVARAAVDVWNTAKVDAVVQLGDVIDGHNATKGCGTRAALAAVSTELDRCTAPKRFDLIGNHEIYNFSRSELPSSGLHCFAPDGKTYRSEVLGDQWEVIILDPFEVWLRGYDDSLDNAFLQEAIATMNKYNKNALSEDVGSWFSGLPEELHRFSPMNGGASQEQVRWLDSTLAATAAAGRRALIFTHVPLNSAASRPSTLVWNADEILSVLHKHGETVVAVIAGHDHDGGYAVDSAGVHHVTMNAALQVPSGFDSCCAVLECYDGWARFVAFGRACVESRSCGKGSAYAEIILARGAKNVPSQPALEAATADKSEAQ